jgi:hypothetical protein
VEIVTKHPNLDRSMRDAVIGGGRVAVEDEPPGGPDIDEVVGDDLPRGVEQPIALDNAADEKECVASASAKATRSSRWRTRSGEDSAGASDAAIS